MKSTFYYTIDVDESVSSSTLLSRQVLDANVDTTSSSCVPMNDEKNPKKLILHVIATYRLVTTCFSSSFQDLYFVLTLDYKRFVNSSEDPTVTIGTIFLSKNNCSNLDGNDATSILIFETTYFSRRSPSCLYHNSGAKVIYPIQKATGLFSKFQSGQVVIDYSNSQRTVEILSSE